MVRLDRIKLETEREREREVTFAGVGCDGGGTVWWLRLHCFGGRGGCFRLAAMHLSCSDLAKSEKQRK